MEDMPLSFSCSDCQRHFPNLPELARHRELRHSSAKQDGEEADGIPHPYGSHPENLANHQRNHETLFFPCTTCGKDFSNRLALQSHMRTHAPESHRRHGPPHAMETAPHLGSETMATDSWGQRLGSGEGWENQTKLVRETHDWESGADPRAASGTWEDPPTKQRQGLEMQPDSKGGTADWVPAVSSEGASLGCQGCVRAFPVNFHDPALSAPNLMDDREDVSPLPGAASFFLASLSQSSI